MHACARPSARWPGVFGLLDQRPAPDSTILQDLRRDVALLARSRSAARHVRGLPAAAAERC